MLVNFVDLDGCDVLKEEKRYVYFFIDEIAEELGDLFGTYNFGANFAGDAPQRAPNDGTIKLSVIPTMIKKPVKGRQLVGMGAEALSKIDFFAKRIREAFQGIRNGEKWP